MLRCQKKGHKRPIVGCICQGHSCLGYKGSVTEVSLQQGMAEQALWIYLCSVSNYVVECKFQQHSRLIGSGN